MRQSLPLYTQPADCKAPPIAFDKRWRRPHFALSPGVFLALTSDALDLGFVAVADALLAGLVRRHLLSTLLDVDCGRQH